MPSTRVLIVDDEPLIRRMLRDLLETAEYSVLEARAGTEGLELAARQQPDVILLDLLMAGLDGYAVCEGLKANPATQAIPVIFVTASPDLALNQKAYAAGAIACLPKPFRREAVVALIETALGRVRRQGLAPPKGAPPTRDEGRTAPLGLGA